MASWFDDMSDTELLDLLPFFEGLAKVDNVYSVLKNANTTTNHNSNLSTMNSMAGEAT